jgi:hypothetical protein
VETKHRTAKGRRYGQKGQGNLSALRDGQPFTTTYVAVTLAAVEDWDFIGGIVGVF